MHVFQLKDEQRVSQDATSKPCTPTSTENCATDPNTSRTSPFFKLPPELRNTIYELVARDQQDLKLTPAGRIRLPPLARVCRRLRAEMRGIFEHEVISNTALPITAGAVNFDFQPLFKWLDENDGQTVPEGKKWAPRTLAISVTYQPKLLLDRCLEEESSQLSKLQQEERALRLLLRNLTTTMNGWNSDIDMLETTLCYPQKLSPRQRMLAKSNDRLRVHPIGMRGKSGNHYGVAIFADDTWRHLHHKTSQKPESEASQDLNFPQDPGKPELRFFDMMYESIKSWGWMWTDVDQKFALMLREACQSDCSDANRKAIATCFDGYQGRIRPNFVVSMEIGWNWKWNYTIINRAAKELSRLDAELHVEQQNRLKHALLTLEEEVKKQRSQAPPFDASANSTSDSTAEQGLNRDSTEDTIEELTKMMAGWHL